VGSASFSPDGARIVTGSDDATAKVWDARTGTALLDLRGHTGGVMSATFGPDGARIVTGSWDKTAKVWDARTGQELRGEPIPPETAPGPISPDARSVAHPVGNRVEVMALNPDAEELDYRRFLTRPNPARYREDYDEAKKAGDEFAARFYFALLPTRSRTDAIVAPLFELLLIRDDVIAALEARPADDPEVQAACLELAGSWTESAQQCDNVVWTTLVFEPGKPDAIYQRGLRLAKAACRLEPDNGSYVTALGIAQYRCGLVAEAIGTLTRSNVLNEEINPTGLAFLALA
jgi:hypothetical protein